MLKKIFATVLVLSIFLIQSSAMAGGYQQYLNGDRNYILFDGHQGGARYAVRNSLNIEKYAPPNYVISIDWVYVPDAYNGSTQNTRRNTSRFGYDWDTRKFYTINDKGEWKLLDPQGSRASGAAFAGEAEIAFYLAYGMKFCGQYNNDFYPDR